MDQVSAAALVPALPDWRRATGPRYTRIAAALRAAIGNGQVPPGAQLPTERALAPALGVSRTTVVAAYDALRRDGLVTRRQGAGTWVNAQPRMPTDRGVPDPGAAGTMAGDPVLGELTGSAPDSADIVCNFASGAMPDAPDLIGDTLHGLPRDGDAFLAGTGYSPGGLPALRHALADHYTRAGLATTPAQIVVTSGAQQAIVVTLAALAPQGRVCVEDPAYPGVLDAIRLTGATALPVPVDRHGVRPDALAAAVTRNKPHVAYVATSCQHPTGAVATPARRRRIADIAAERAMPIIDDTTLADLVIEGEQPPPLAAYRPEAPIITIGSLAKLYWGGLRVGWIRAPEHLVPRLGATRAALDIGTSPLLQILALRLLARMADVREYRHRQLHSARETAGQLLAEHLPQWTSARPAGGLVLWVRLPGGHAAAFAHVARAFGTPVAPGWLLSAGNGHADRLRLRYVQPPQALTLGIPRLAMAWETYISGHRTPTALPAGPASA